MMNNNGYMNWIPQQPGSPFSMPAPKYDIIKVSGEASARSFRMAPNSSALLLDETAPIVWYASTDGTGYLTVTPFDIVPHAAKPEVDLNDLLSRVQKLEDMYVQQSNSIATKQSKKHQQQSNSVTES